MSRDRGSTASPQHGDGGDHSHHSTERGDWRVATAGIGEKPPDDLVPYDELTGKDLRTEISWPTRRRIREAVEQLGSIVAARVVAASSRSGEGRAQSTASRNGLVLELREIRIAEQKGSRADLRAAYMSAAASCVLLAEATDRPKEVPAIVARRAKYRAEGKK